MTSIAYIAISEDVSNHHAGLTHSRGICKGLAAAGNEVFLFLRGEQESQRVVDGVTEWVLPRHGFWKPLWGNEAKAWDRARSTIASCDVVHERYSVNPLSRWLTGEKRVILEVNDPLTKTWTGWQSAIYPFFISYKKKQVKGIITQTKTLASLLKPEFLVPVGVVSNGVDLSLFSHFNSNHKVVKRDAHTVIFLGSFREWHGVEQLPLIIEQVSQKVPSAQFVFVGDGPLRSTIESQINQTPFSSRVRFTGQLPMAKVVTELEKATVAIAPFDLRASPALAKYGFWWCPVKLFEYLAAGLPTVSYHFEEVKTIVGNAGVLVEPQNVSAFSSEIVKLLSKKEPWKKCSSQAFARAKTFSWEKKALETIQFYQKT